MLNLIKEKHQYTRINWDDPEVIDFYNSIINGSLNNDEILEIYNNLYIFIKDLCDNQTTAKFLILDFYLKFNLEFSRDKVKRSFSK